jgi:hypothetical protein
VISWDFLTFRSVLASENRTLTGHVSRLAAS